MIGDDNSDDDADGDDSDDDAGGDCVKQTDEEGWGSKSVCRKSLNQQINLILECAIHPPLHCTALRDKKYGWQYLWNQERYH